ncbi:zinc finger domain-containing protein [Streptomyces scopuliridis]|uniref:zinc finger domain-containing protein n=1 Tax=Streptomyces scopuliridis TaxID=452529 RepID=UPI003442E43A
MSQPTNHQPLTPEEAPALNSPALTVTCPTCDSAPGDLCTSHSGTRQRRDNVHRTRTAALPASD